MITVAVLLGIYLPPALVLAWIDGREHRLPNSWVGGLTLAVSVALLLEAVLIPASRSTLSTAALLALLIGAGAILLALVAPPLLGMGDAKSVPVVVLMSAALGGDVLLASLLGIAVISGLAGGAVMIVTGRAGVSFAVGPILLAGPFLGLLGAPVIGAALGTSG